MLITVKCPCGRSLKAKGEMAGKKARCPNCNNVLTLPPPLPPEDEEEVVEVANVEVVDEDSPSDRDDDDDDERSTRRYRKKRKKSFKHQALFDKSRPMFGNENSEGLYGGFVGPGVIISVSVVLLILVALILWIIFHD